MVGDIHIGVASRELGVTPEYLRLLDWRSRIPQSRRDRNGGIYSGADSRNLRVLGVGSRPRRLRSPAEATW